MAKRILDWQTSWLAMASPRTLANTMKEPQRAPIQRCVKRLSRRFVTELSEKASFRSCTLSGSLLVGKSGNGGSMGYAVLVDGIHGDVVTDISIQATEIQ